MSTLINKVCSCHDIAVNTAKVGVKHQSINSLWNKSLQGHYQPIDEYIPMKYSLHYLF